MTTRRWRVTWLALIAVAVVWAAAVTGYILIKHSRVTAEKVRAYAESVDLRQLHGEARAKALRRLAAMLNALSPEERRQARLERLGWRWLDQMSDEEKSQFIDATLPTGFKQMITAFEQLPEDKRQRAVDDALRRLREDEAQLRQGVDPRNDRRTNGPPVLSDELEAKIRTIGLKAFYSQSSAQTKAELAPVLEELQRTMESGRAFRGRFRDRRRPDHSPAPPDE